MESEKVKEIKELLLRKAKEYESQTLLDILTLINELESENEKLNKTLVANLDAYRDGFTDGANLNNKVENKWKEENQQLKNKVAELESENERLKIVVDIANERTYRKKFNDEWRKEYQKELDKEGKGHIAGFPDFDLVYKLYFDQKDRIAELERENETIKFNIQETEKASFNINQMNGNLVVENQQLKDRIAELEKENALIKSSVAMRDYKTLEEIINNRVKQFAEMLKNNCAYSFIFGQKFITEKRIDELLKEYEK